ncbi:MAG: hypothetical protein MZU97_07865 [Bacillus subtilis]|nr:hypothetical protein [Bacillus subtilis]
MGRRTHQKASGLSFGEVLVCDPYVDAEVIEAAGGRKRDLREVAARCDFLSVHAPLTPDTRHLISKELVESMKPTAILVNTSRGPILDEAALCSALRDGRIPRRGLGRVRDRTAPVGQPPEAPGQRRLQRPLCLLQRGSHRGAEGKGRPEHRLGPAGRQAALPGQHADGPRGSRG